MAKWSEDALLRAMRRSGSDVQIVRADSTDLDDLLDDPEETGEPLPDFHAWVQPNQDKTEYEREMARARREKLQRIFRTGWLQLGGYDGLVAEYRFHPALLYRFDFAIPPIQVAFEINGGTWLKRGGHSWGPHVTRDYRRLHAAIFLGWTVFPFTTDMLSKKNIVGSLEPVIEYVNARLADAACDG